MSTSSHAWAAGHGVALASLSNISDLLYGRNRQTVSSPRRPVGVQTGITNNFPVSKQTLDYATSGAGFASTTLEVTLFALAYNYILTTYFSSGTVRSAAFTLYYPRLETGGNDRVSCYITQPTGPDEIAYLRYGLIRATFNVSIVAVL